MRKFVIEVSVVSAIKLCYLEGGFVAPEEARLPVSDLLVQRGVGVFETVATYEGRPLMLTSHLERLIRSAESSRIQVSLTMNQMAQVVRDGLARVGGEAQIKLYFSGGDAFDDAKGFTRPRFFVIFEELVLPSPENYERGVTLDPLPCGRDDPSVKSVDYRATYVWPQSEGASSGTFPKGADVLYCPNGEITEAGHSTFFLVKEGRLVTAPLSRVLKGTTRQAILELARSEGIAVEERCPLLSELGEAEEAFITGSIKKVLAVTKIGDQVIGDGRPGPVTLRLSKLYLQRIEQWLE